MTTDTNLPPHASVVVVGGGIMGCSTLYHLAKSGVRDAVLLERNELTSGTTWHSAAQVRALRSTRNMTNLIKYSISLYAELERETGQATGWINKGSLSIATSPDRLIHIRRQEAMAHLYDVNASFISREEAMEIWPMMNGDDVIGAVWSPDDGRVSPSDLCAALAKGAKTRGAKIFENTGVTGILTGNGKITGVETGKGAIRCDAIALCTGLWSRQAAAMAGADLPVWPCEHFYLLTKPVEGVTGNMPTLSDHDSRLYIRDDSGGLLVGCFEPMGKAIDPAALGDDFAFGLLPEDWDHFEPMMINALHRLPALETAEVRTLLNGPESFTPDGAFLLGEAAETKGLFLGCGMNSVGVATGGGAGMALAHNIVEGRLPFDLNEVDPRRFDGAWNSVSALSARVPEVLGKHYEITYPGRQWTTARNLKKIPLHSEWENKGACFGQVGGWERPRFFEASTLPKPTFGKPDWFEQVDREVNQAHAQAAVFDQSTFGKIRIRGKHTAEFLNRLCTNNMHRPPGSVTYTTMLNERGGIESDFTVFRLTEDDYRIYTGTTALKRDMAWMKRHVEDGEEVSIEDETADLAVLALMGPRSGRVAENLGIGELNDIRYFHFTNTALHSIGITAARLSYVGEFGWEITCNRDDAVVIYRAISDAGVSPSGLLAQTSMRIEKQFPAYGHDLDTDLSPIQGGLDFAIDWKSDFVGKQALLEGDETEPASRICSIVFTDPDAWPIGGEPVYLNGDIIGKTTSAAYGYRLGKHVAIALMPALGDGTEVEVRVGGENFSAIIHHRAPFDPSGERMRENPKV